MCVLPHLERTAESPFHSMLTPGQQVSELTICNARCLAAWPLMYQFVGGLVTVLMTMIGAISDFSHATRHAVNCLQRARSRSNSALRE